MNTEIKVGQKWEEQDPRNPRKVQVLAVEPERIKITCVSYESYSAPARWVKRQRFNGKRGGYSLLTEG